MGKSTKKACFQLLERARRLKESGLSYKGVAEELGVAKQTVSYWLNPEQKEKGRIRRNSRQRANRKGSHREFKSTVTYFIAAPEVKLVKIGTSKSPGYRFEQLRTLNACNLILLGYSNTSEADWHVKFKGEHSHGEWFKATEELLNCIERSRTDFQSPGA